MVGTPADERGRMPRDHGGQRLGLQEPLRQDEVGPGQEARRRGCPRRWRGTSGTMARTRSRSLTPSETADGDGHRVQERRAVAVDDPLRVAGRAGRVAHGRGLALVELRPVVTGLLGAEQLLVGEGLTEAVGVARARHHDVLDGRGSGRVTRASRGDDEASTMITCVLGVVDDVGQLLGEEPEVEGVQHRPHRRGRPGRPRGAPGCSGGRCPPGRRRRLPRRSRRRPAVRNRVATSAKGPRRRLPAGPVTVRTRLSP